MYEATVFSIAYFLLKVPFCPKSFKSIFLCHFRNCIFSNITSDMLFIAVKFFKNILCDAMCCCTPPCLALFSRFQLLCSMGYHNITHLAKEIYNSTGWLLSLYVIACVMKVVGKYFSWPSILFYKLVYICSCYSQLLVSSTCHKKYEKYILPL